MNTRNHAEIIAVYSTHETQARTDYAINLAAALVSVTKGHIAVAGNIDQISLEIGIDVLNPDSLEANHEILSNYKYIVVDVSPRSSKSIYSIFLKSHVIHFFVDSTKENLQAGNAFLEKLLHDGYEEIHNKIKVIAYRLNIFDRFSVEDMTWLIKKDIWVVVPEPGVLEVPVDAKGFPQVLSSPDSIYSKSILRIAKTESGKLLGVALGSGGAFGLAHIGVLRILEQNRIPVDMLSGSSIGALIASLWGLGFSSDKMEDIAKRLRSKLNMMRLMDFSIPISGILAGRRLRMFLRSILGEKTFEDLQIPVKIMVYDLANRETILVEKGPLLDAVYKSTVIPGIFEPIVEKEKMIIDGGVSDPVPVDALLEAGVRKIIAVNVLPSPQDMHEKNMMLKSRLSEEENMLRTSPFYIRITLVLKRFFRKVFTPNIFDVIMSSMQSMEFIMAENSCRKADVALHPVLADASSVDFHKVKSFVKRGEHEAMMYISKIKELASR